MGRPNKDMVYLGRMRDLFAQHRALPSYAELSRVLGFRAKNASFKLCARLAADGYVESGQSGRLLPGRRFFELPQVDERIPAGTGEPGEFAGGVEPQVLDHLLIDVPSKTVLIQVRGDSMSDAGVLDGDTAIVERTENARHGDFVVARFDGQYTLKELQFERNRPMLVPHNRHFATIKPQAELSIVGIVRGIVRRYPSAAGPAPTQTRGEKK